MKDFPLMLFKFERQPQPIAFLSSTSAEGSMTRTFEDATCRNAQTQIKALQVLQPVITPVQGITPDSDGKRQKMRAC